MAVGVGYRNFFNLKNQFNNPILATLVDYYEINIVSADKFTIK